MTKAKSAIALISVAVIVLTATILIFVLDMPKYNSVDAIEILTVAEETQITEKEEAVNINTADAEELTKLFGVGEKRAADIVEYREKNGRFRSIEELTNINGISESVIEKNSDIIVV